MPLSSILEEVEGHAPPNGTTLTVTGITSLMDQVTLERVEPSADGNDCMDLTLRRLAADE